MTKGKRSVSDAYYNAAEELLNALSGKSIDAVDRKLVLSLLKRSAELGSSTAMFELGQSYEEFGLNKPKARLAAYWYQLAAKRGHAEACNSLAYLYEVGHGVRQSNVRAFSLYKKAAKLGSSLAALNLAECFKRGDIVQRDLKLARKYRVLAAKLKRKVHRRVT